MINHYTVEIFMIKIFSLFSVATTRSPATTKSVGVRSGEGSIYDDVLCEGRLDTILTTQGQTFVFYGSKYWKLTESGVKRGYPQPIAEGWDQLPWSLDASFTWTNGNSYFFKGSQYWRFSELGKMDSGYPKEISEGFEGIPNNVDGAIVWSANDKIYFFKGDKYWKYDPDASPSVDSSYPRPISMWKGIPDNIDAAVTYSNSKAYFFKSGKYYKFDDETLAVSENDVYPYPRDIGEWWFGCE